MNKLIAFFILVMSLFSCDYSYNYSYNVDNKTDDTIMISVKKIDLDSVFTLIPDSTYKLFTENHDLEGPSGPYQLDVNLIFDKFIVFKEIINCDTLKSKRDYLLNNAWDYKNGEYTTIITKSEFE